MVTGYRAVTGRVVRILAMVVGGLAMVQFGLAGYGAFTGVAGHGQHGYEVHQALGMVIGLISLLVAVAALVARPSTRTVVLGVVLFLAAGLLQPSLAELGKDGSAWWGLLHALVGTGILGLAGTLSRSVPAAQREAVAASAA